MANQNKPSSAERRGHNRSSEIQQPEKNREDRDQMRDRASRESYNKDRSDR